MKYIISEQVNNYLYEFVKNFLMGGFIIGVYSLLIKYFSEKLAGHASGALPLVFTYVVIFTYKTYGFERAKNVSLIGFKGGFFWLAYTAIVTFMLKYNYSLVYSFSCALIIFIIINYIYYKISFKK